MRDYDVGLSIVRYMHNIRLTLDKNGKYQYSVSVPRREVSTNCRDRRGYYNASTGKCKVPPPCYDASGNPQQPVIWYGHMVCPLARYTPQYIHYYNSYEYTGTVRVPDNANLVLGYSVTYSMDDDISFHDFSVWDASVPISCGTTTYRSSNPYWCGDTVKIVSCSGPSFLYRKQGEGNTFVYDVIPNAGGRTVSYRFYALHRPALCIRRPFVDTDLTKDYHDFIFGWEMIPSIDQPAYVKSMYEKITYNYATEADVKVYAVSINGDRQFLGFKTEKGYSFSFTVNKSRSDLLGQKLTPDYFTDKIISIRNNVFDIVRYKDEGVTNVGSLVIK
jgi:hypothetical protein